MAGLRHSQGPGVRERDQAKYRSTWAREWEYRTQATTGNVTGLGQGHPRPDIAVLPYSGIRLLPLRIPHAELESPHRRVPFAADHKRRE